ncbi:MraY family glycosyltransferase [Phaeacidiphilus oryzae]|uniref:MraY family glycosyltransferase n=1 Tax=Phaeacidiphilus oryzae TaxID=348818 RepID=UPI00068F00B7|nr:MraY family glycosyltransferase [Phaeacidiphilus oryzae]
MREYLLTLFVTAAVTYLLTGPVRKFAIAAGAMPPIRARDVHREPTPRLGGIAMFGGLCAGLLVAGNLNTAGDTFVKSHDVAALLSGGTIMWILGVLDDKWGVDALVKLGGQIVAAGVMVWQGVTVLWLPIPGYGNVSFSPLQGTLIAVLLVVFTVNAVNFIDGLDGLAAGMVCIAAAAFFLYAYRLWYGYSIEDASPAVLFSAILIGMCAGFLPHNLHPARIFMGDSGSMLIGLVLSVAAISLTGRVDPDVITAQNGGSQTDAVHTLVPVYIPLLLPLTVIALPLADLLLAVVRRTWAGKSPFAADKQHLHHRLLEIGHSHARAVLIMYFWAALIAFGTVAFSVSGGGLMAVLILLALCAVGLVVLLIPRFQPHVPRLLARMVPPRYRRPVGDVVSEGGAEGAGLSAEANAVTDRQDVRVNEASTSVKVREVLTSEGGEFSADDEDLLRRIGSGSHALRRHSDVPGRNHQ